MIVLFIQIEEKDIDTCGRELFFYSIEIYREKIQMLNSLLVRGLPDILLVRIIKKKLILRKILTTN